MPPSSGAERDSPPEGDRRLRHQHSASSDHGSRALVPMWDSSDPDRAPPPLPLNPQSPSFSSRAGTSTAIQSAHAALSERARESAALVPALARRMNDGSPEKALVKGSHRRMQSLQPGSVRDLSLMLEGPRTLPQTPARPPERQDRPSTPTQGYPRESVFESRPIELCIDGPTSMPGPSLTPIVRPTVRRPATTHSILGENTPPQSSTMLALQTMGARPSSQDGERVLSNITNGASFDKGPHTLEGLSSQILGLTSIAQSLKKDLNQLSRRSKDNATDLLSLKEATSTRDEDIRRGLRDLMGNMSEASSRITSREHFGALFIDNKPHCTSPSNGRPFQLPRIPSPKSFADSIDGASVSTPSLSGAEGAASIALLERILRGIGTKEGNESLLDLLKELSEKLSGMVTADKIDELAQLVREQSESAIVPDVSVRYRSQAQGEQGSLEHNDNGVLTQRMERLLYNTESRRSSAPPGRGAELLNEDLIQIIRSVKDSVAQGGGLTAEVKALVRELRGEVLGMGRELGKRLEKMGDKAIEESEAPSKDEVSRVIDEGLEQMKEQLNHVLREHRRQSQASASSQKTLVDYQEIYNAMRAALRDNEASRGEMPDLSREDVIEAVRDAWENYKPEIEVQHLGLEREEVLTCLKEGLQEYMPRDEKPEGATREEVFKAVVEGLKHFVPPQMDTTATISRDEIIEAVRDCLEEFEFPVSASAIGHDMTHSEMVHAVKEGLEGLDLPRGDALVAHSNNDEVLTRLHDVMAYLKVEFKAVSEEAKENVAANGRDTEQVLDATNDGLENLRAAIEAYVDRATGVAGQEEFMESLAKSMDEFKEDLAELVSQAQARDAAHDERDTDQIVESTKDGLENLRVALESYVDRAAGASGQEEFMESLVRSMDDFKEEIAGLVSQTQAQDDSHNDRDTEQILESTKDGLENLRVAIESYVDRAAGASGQDEVAESISRSMEELKEHLAHVVSKANDSSREQLQTELEGLREIVNSSMVPAAPLTPTNNQEVLEALHTGLNSLRQEILRPRPETSEILDALQEGLNDLRVGIDQVTHKPVDLTANDEIMDALRSGLESVRADIETMRESSNSKAVAAVTALSDEASDNAIVPADMIKQDDIKNLEVLITQLGIKIEAMEPPRESETLQQEDLGRLEDMLRDVQERVIDISTREPPAPAENEEEEARDATPAANGDAATKEDVEAIETILRNTKALLDDLIDGEQAVRKEHLDVVESLALETRETLGSVSEQLGGVCRKEDLAELEALLSQVSTRLDETKELAEKDAADDDKATKTDVEAVETVVLEMKTILDGLAGTDFAALSSKEDVAGLETAVKEAAEKLETHVETSSKAFDDRQAEIVGVADRVTDVKAFLEEFQETVKGRLEEGSTGFEALNKRLEGINETVSKNENVGTDLKEMLDTMKTQFDESKEVVAGARLESNEKLQEAAENIGTKIDDKMAELMTKYDEFKVAMDERNAAGEVRDIETEAAVVGTKAVAEEVKLLIDTLGSTVTDSLEKMEEASKTVFAQVEKLASRAEENYTDGKTEHQQTRDQILQTVTAVEELQGEVKEFHPQILEAVKDLLLLVGEHFEHSKASTTDLQDKIVESKPPEQPALPPPEKYDDSEVREKLDRLVELKYDDTEVRETLGRLIQDKYDDSLVLERLEKLAEQRYDDGGVQEKLDRLVEHSDSTAEALARLETLDQVHQSVCRTAADLSQFLSNQTQRIANEHDDRERTLQETAATLERKRAEKEHLEASVSSLRDEEERLRQSVVDLRSEQESLIRQKTRLTGDVSSLETAMRLRKEALSDMEYRADRLERRIMEGVMDHSRVLLMAKSSREGDKMSRKRTKKPATQHAEACKARPAVNIALSANRNLAPTAQNGAARRIASLSQMNNGSPSSMVKRSQSVRTPNGTALRKRSWGGGMGKGFDAEDKENVSLGKTVEEVEEPPSLDGETGGDDDDTTVLDSTVVNDDGDDDDHSDAGTLRRSSMGTTVLTSSTGQYTESEAAYSEYDDGGSEYSESAVGTEAGGDHELVVYGQ